MHELYIFIIERIKRIRTAKKSRREEEKCHAAKACNTEAQLGQKDARAAKKKIENIHKYFVCVYSDERFTENSPHILLCFAIVATIFGFRSSRLG